MVFSGQVLTLVEELLGEEEVYDERDGYGPYGAAYAVRHEERKELGAGGKARAYAGRHKGAAQDHRSLDVYFAAFQI